jgi:sulfatase maturation enzyme AslB (radical SAM superfamily)
MRWRLPSFARSLATSGRASSAARTRPYYGYCGGGAPANKYYENGSFASTQTMYGRYAVQMPLDIVLNDIEQSLEVSG